MIRTLLAAVAATFLTYTFVLAGEVDIVETKRIDPMFANVFAADEYEGRLRAQEEERERIFRESFIRVEGQSLEELHAAVDRCRPMDDLLGAAFPLKWDPVEGWLEQLDAWNAGQNMAGVIERDRLEWLKSQFNATELLSPAEVDALLEACVFTAVNKVIDRLRFEITIRTSKGDVVMTKWTGDTTVAYWRSLRRNGFAASYVFVVRHDEDATLQSVAYNKLTTDAAIQ